MRDSEEGVQCDGCRSWLHTQCGGISHHSYTQMVREEEEGKHCPWLCPGGALISQADKLSSSVNNREMFRLQPLCRLPTKNSTRTSQLSRYQWSLGAGPGNNPTGGQTAAEGEQEEPSWRDSSSLLSNQGERQRCLVNC